MDCVRVPATNSHQLKRKVGKASTTERIKCSVLEQPTYLQVVSNLVWMMEMASFGLSDQMCLLNIHQICCAHLVFSSSF